MIWISGILALAILVVIGGGLWYRCKRGLGIGWQFIRYTVIGVALPICALLALNDALTAPAATILAGAMGYAFGKAGGPDSKKSISKNVD